eukprot:scaffold2602_cov246-Pinguiococcus_pyrenoidosus.AAC.8
MAIKVRSVTLHSFFCPSLLRSDRAAGKRKSFQEGACDFSATSLSSQKDRRSKAAESAANDTFRAGRGVQDRSPTLLACTLVQWSGKGSGRKR